MAKKHDFKGTGVAIATPFRKDGSVDFKSLEKLIEHLIKGKIEYIVALGTTGESVVLSKEEKAAITEHILDTVDGRLPVVLGIGGNNTSEIIHTIEKSDLDRIAAILSVSPYYNKPSQEGIYQHYKAIADASPLPVILYNVPSRTASNISAETTLRLANDFDNIIGTKEASGNFTQVMDIIKRRPKDFLVISGDDLITLPMIASGGDGVISVVANAFPKDFSEMTRQALKGNFEEARKLHYKLTDITNLLFADGNPGGIKAALEIMGICQNNLRLPIVPVNKKVYTALQEEIKKYK
ncbi:MAG TPA: 4-hydroxy-tetrahydrodipicolinate synthase [Bacteroidia bacterium]|jgi:4-hydroxy-tetrahydrodipicolinate synthase|nr:4-hydroxy-tetrahydrodipicolinate synthase [Bacteroidia bacterium]